MATTTKKGSKNKRAKLRRPMVKTSVAEQAQTIAELRQQLAESAKELQGCKRQLTEAFEQQTGTSAILRMIAKSPTDIQSVLDTMAEYSARLCGADDAVIWRVEGDSLILVAHFGSIRLMYEIGWVVPSVALCWTSGTRGSDAPCSRSQGGRSRVPRFPGGRDSYRGSHSAGGPVTEGR